MDHLVCVMRAALEAGMAEIVYGLRAIKLNDGKIFEHSATC